MTGPVEAACPRCGYDLSGAIAAWGDSRCPLVGVCSECGLELRWSEVLNPSLTVPPWSFEHAMRQRTRRLIRTWASALLPWRFWRDLRMEHEIRPRRLLFFALTLCLLVHLGYSIEHVWRSRVSSGVPIMADPEMLRYSAWPYYQYDRSLFAVAWPSTGPAEVAALALIIGAPLAMLVLPDTFKIARVRRSHILRGAIYGLTGPAVVAVAMSAIVAATFRGRWFAFGASFAWVNLVQTAITLVAIAWFACYWILFTRRYLRLPSPGIVAAVVLGLAALLAVVAATTVYPSDVGMLIFQFLPGWD